MSHTSRGNCDLNNVVQKLRLQIIKDPKMLEKSTGVIVFDLPKGNNDAEKSQMTKRGLADLESGKNTGKKTKTKKNGREPKCSSYRS